MASLTATILIYGAQPEMATPYLIELTENSRPALILNQFERDSTPIVIIPTVENMAEDVLLMIAVYILKKVEAPVQLHNHKSQTMYDLLTDKERKELYTQSLKAIKKSKLRLIFNLLEGSALLNQVEKIKDFSPNLEITVPLKNEKRSWS